MKALDLLTRDEPLSILFFGSAGSGKTALVSQIGSDGYLFDFDRGMRTAITLQDKFTPLRQSVEFDIYVDTNPAQPTAYLKAREKLNQLVSLSSQKKLPYKYIALDSLTGLCRAVQLHTMFTMEHNAFAVPHIQHYGVMVNEVESVLTLLRSLGVTILVTAHEMLLETKEGDLIRIMSVTRPHGINKIPWQFDEVLYTKAKPRGQGKMEYTVTGAHTMSIGSARTRSGLISDVVHNEIGLAGLLAMMSEGVAATKAKLQQTAPSVSSQKGGVPAVR